MLLLALLACASPPIPQPVVDQVAESLCSLGHPNATFKSGTIVNSERGTFSQGTHDRYVDVDMVYVRSKKSDAGEHTMCVRLYLESVHPCRVSMDVLSDDGPSPWLLDNGVASDVVGEKICSYMAP
jgi:hypothetical protein